ncbi:PTS system mannose/fructose/N-acetylgalactosamine-transporter subunit IIB [Lacticaseibacillus daqingensis]|uniref:PTS system mannose/fructose/N-acetylgalactosamine-transporter subunit IIB n=1 Tax=Lacticaseibacillus daqingensis TaxID=2486014 RepID=UPI000F7A7342
MPGIIHIRIDERMIHGQVAAFWTNTLKATRIMVINDEVANDEVEKKMLRMAAPGSVATSILTKETAVKNILSGRYEGHRVLMIVKTPEDIAALIAAGLPIKQFNVGNMSAKAGTHAVKKSVNVTDEQVALFNRLMADGVTITAQMVPDDQAASLATFLK